MSAPSVTIRPARASDAVLLSAIEGSAGALFRTLPDLSWVADAALPSPDYYLPLIAAGLVWVAEDAQGRLAGELRAQIADDALHILELAVAHDFQQRGLGRRLLDTAWAAARARGLRALTLTTFRHVAWNAPFYRRYGFAELSGDAIGPWLQAILDTEEGELHLPNRCAMRLMLDGG